MAMEVSENIFTKSAKVSLITLPANHRPMALTDISKAKHSTSPVHQIQPSENTTHEESSQGQKSDVQELRDVTEHQISRVSIFTNTENIVKLFQRQ